MEIRVGIEGVTETELTVRKIHIYWKTFYEELLYRILRKSRRRFSR